MNIIELEFATASLEDLKLSRTETSQAADSLEDDLASLLKEKMAFLMALHNKDKLQIQDLKEQYGNEIEAAIHVTVFEAYMEGAKYTGKVLGEPSIYPSPENAAKIDVLTTSTDAFFWRQMNLEIQAEETKKAAKQSGLTDEQFASLRRASPLLSLYGIGTAAELVANDAVTTSVAVGTVDKLKELKHAKPKYGSRNWKVVFVSRHDGIVCVICAALDYRYSHVEWEVGSPFIIFPRYQTHRRCRCRLMIKEGDKLYTLF